MTNSSSVSTSFSSCIALRYALSLGITQRLPWLVSANFLVWQNKTVPATINNDPDVYLT